MNHVKNAIKHAFGITETVDCFGVAQFRIKKPLHTAPGIIREYYDKDKVRMYECEGGRHFIAAVYDKMFIPAKMPLMPKNYKGDNACYKKIRR